MDWMSFFLGAIAMMAVFAIIAVLTYILEDDSSNDKDCNNPRIPLIDRQRKAMKE